MTERNPTRRNRGWTWAWPAVGLATIAFAVACAPREEEVASNPEGAPDSAAVPQQWDTIASTNWTTEDWRILDEKVRWATQQRLDTLPIGEAMAQLGATFVGTTYTPGTLEAPGEEHLVINLRELDCVTFIENVLAMTWLIRNEGQAILSDQAAAMRRYEQYLTAVRYRDAQLNGYPSRLHYFSEWLSDNEARGLIKIRTRELGGVPDREPIAFMTSHRDAYRQLTDSAFFAEIGRTEARLNAQGPRYYIPEADIPKIEKQIHNGDIIAGTSTLQGLDIAHTGFAYWKDGRLHLMHAPLVGKNVEISALPVPERLQGITAQDGIMVATPQEWPGSRPGGGN
jgi:hypothetical protein